MSHLSRKRVKWTVRLNFHGDRGKRPKLIVSLLIQLSSTALGSIQRVQRNWKSVWLLHTSCLCDIPCKKKLIINQLLNHSVHGQNIKFAVIKSGPDKTSHAGS